MGTTISIPAKSSRNLNVLGFLNINKQKLFASCTYDRVDTDVVIENFNLFAEEITKETVVVIDNASIHTSNKFKSMIEKWESQGLKIFNLLPYSPQLNPIDGLKEKFRAYDNIDIAHDNNILLETDVDIFNKSKMQNYDETIILRFEEIGPNIKLIG